MDFFGILAAVLATVLVSIVIGELALCTKRRRP